MRTFQFNSNLNQYVNKMLFICQDTIYYCTHNTVVSLTIANYDSYFKKVPAMRSAYQDRRRWVGIAHPVSADQLILSQPEGANCAPPLCYLPTQL